MNWRPLGGDWLVASLAGGAWLGVLGRGVMSLIALAAGQSPRWSWGGTWEILVMAMIVSTLVTLAWMVLRRLVPFLRRGRGALPGVIVFIGFVLIPPPSATSALAGIGQRNLSTLLFGILLVGFGMVVEGVLVHRATRRLGPPAPP